MILDARSFESGKVHETDICIVGAGTVGLTLARELAGGPMRVTLLESGGKEPDPKTQSLAFGENIGLPYFPLDTARARFLGGTSTRWHVPMGPERMGARMRPFDPIDFEVRDWVPYSGWPFGKADLEPFYDRAQAICQIQPNSFAVDDWSDAESRPALSLADGEVQTIIYKIGDREPFVTQYPREVAQADNINIYLHAHVLEIETNSTADHATALRIGVIDGREFRVSARMFVLAAGGIEVPRLLLLSNHVQTAGLGNQHDLVGRFFMEHPHFWSGVFIPAKPELLEATRLYNDIHMVNGVAIVGKLALNEATLRREHLLNQNIQLVPWLPSRGGNPLAFWGVPEPIPPGVASARLIAAAARGRKVDNIGRHVSQVLRGLDDVAVAVARKLRRKLTGAPARPPVYIFSNMSEQVPNPESRVRLGTESDLFGQPRVQLDWRVTAQDIRSARRTQEIIGNALERAGLGRFSQKLRDDNPPDNLEGGYHHMGTTRMHRDPKQGVVDPNCRVHGIGNLFVAGASVFPTSGYANPVLTSLALAIRLADHLKTSMNGSR